MIKETLENLIPDDWENDLTYADIKYVRYERTKGPHCEQSVRYRDVAGHFVYSCTHKRTEE
jgi:hypothetical protein